MIYNHTCLGVYRLPDFFTHHVSRSIQPSQINTAISKEVEKRIEEAFSEEIKSDASDNFEKAIPEIKCNLSHKSQVSISSSGYVQYIDNKTLLHIAQKEDLLLNIRFKPGKYLVKDAVIINVFSKKNQ